jgi:hypothetical protein
LLVEVQSKHKQADNWRWRSSLTRDDTGNGVCELIWIKDFSMW